MRKMFTAAILAALMMLSAMPIAHAQGNAWGQRAGEICAENNNFDYRNRGQCSATVAELKAAEENGDDDEE
jgi:hypothetical protein